MCVWLKLTIMKLASRKNMTSIKGMISMRARLCGIGEEIWMAKSVGCAGHGEGDGNFYFRDRARSKSPLSERARCGVIQYRIADALRHGGVGHAAARGVNRDHANTAAHNAARTRLIRVLRTRRESGQSLGAGHRHRAWRFDWYYPHRPWLVRRRRPFRRCLHRRLDDSRRNIGKIDWRRLAFHRGNHGTNMYQGRATKSGPQMPSGRRSVEQRFDHNFS